MSIKTAAERLREKYPSNTDHDDLLIDYVEFIEFQRAEAAELRAAYEALKAENTAQAKRISELENDLIEWNEFKKIRDAQMQSLRKQMP